MSLVYILLPILIVAGDIGLAYVVRTLIRPERPLSSIAWACFVGFITAGAWILVSLPFAYYYAFCCIGISAPNARTSGEADLFFRTLALPSNACSYFPVFREWLGGSCYNVTWVSFFSAFIIIAFLVIWVARSDLRDADSKVIS